MKYLRKGKSKDELVVKKKRFFKVLDYDPELTVKQLQERFEVSAQVIINWRKEWKGKDGQ